MTFPSQIFRAYDIRGVVESELTPKLVEKIGRAFAEETLEHGINQLVVGRDGRLSGEKLVNALTRGILRSGCDVIDIGMVPTPTLYFAALRKIGCSGVQVTGSHNPKEYNGLKMMISGMTLSGEEIQSIKNRVIADDFVDGNGRLHHENILSVYKQAIEDDIHLARPLKVVVDCGNGVAGVIAPQVLRSIGCEVIELFCEVDGNFPNHHPDPSRPENLQALCQAVEQHSAAFGMAFDGDGDRLGVVSGIGEIIWPDRQMVLFADSILKKHPGAEIIFDVKCTQILQRAIEANGGIATICKTGHSFIKKKLRESGAIFAGEMSGHLFFSDRWGGFDDGIYASARLCELLAASEYPPGEVFANLPNTVNTPELLMPMEEGENQVLVNELLVNARFDDARIQTIDGIRVDFEDGFGLIRASNTTPAITMRFEASTQQQLEAIQDRFRRLFRDTRPDLCPPF